MAGPGPVPPPRARFTGVPGRAGRGERSGSPAGPGGARALSAPWQRRRPDGEGGGGRARRFAGSSRGEGSSGGRGAHGSRFEPRRRAVVARAAFPRGSGTLRARAPALAPGRGGGGGSGGCPGSRGGDPAAPLPVVLPAP